MSETLVFLAMEVLRRFARARAVSRHQVAAPAPPAPEPVPRPIIALGYDLAVVWPNVTAADVHRAYRRRARREHPDGGGSDARFNALRGHYQAALKLVKGNPPR